ncbi:MAG: FAD-binding oxidoreductase [bacterium]
MNRIDANPDGERRLLVGPGVSLDEVRATLEESPFFFPPDPTESSASIGGMISTNASGALSYFYGPTRKWVEALRVVLADGSRLTLRRGQRFAAGRTFALVTEEGREIGGQLPSYRMPGVKNAAGYYVDDNMDLLDLFIGMEGTLGIITGADLRLMPRPAARCGLTAFLPSREAALLVVRRARGEAAGGQPGLLTRPAAIEYFNHDTLALLRRMKADGKAAAGLPPLMPHYHTAVYLEYHGLDEETVEAAAVAAIDAAVAAGGNEADTWYAATPRDMERQKAFRYAVPEAVNLLISERQRTDPAIIKLGTDMAVPDASLEWVMTLYGEDLAAAGLESVIFGHIGNNHVHVNILPRTKAEYDLGKALYQSWARRIVGLGGTVSAEHGIGRIKAPLLVGMFGEAGVAQMRALKRLFDPGLVLNPGVLFNGEA